MSIDASITPPPNPIEKSWFYIFMGFMSVAALATAAGVLYTQFVLTRPIDIRPHTKVLAQKADDILSEYVSREHIRMGELIPLSEGRTYYNFYPFDVLIPAHLDEAGLVAYLKPRLREYRVQVLPPPAQSTEHAIHLKYGSYVFAKINWQQDDPAEVSRTDLRQASYAVAQDVEVLLMEAGVDLVAINRGPTVDLEDEETYWAKTDVQVDLGAVLNPVELRKAMMRRLKAPELRIETAALGQTQERLDIFLGDKLCTSVLCDWVDAVEATPDAVASATNEATPGMPEPVEEEQAEDVDAALTEDLLAAMPEDATGITTETMKDTAKGIEIAEASDQEDPIEPGELQVAAAVTEPRIAIILDDGGYGGLSTEKVLNLDPRFTVSILPNTPYATETARQAGELGFEVMLHMPMESNSKTDTPVEGFISTDMTSKEIQGLTRAALGQIPGVVGVNNHTGSKFTSDAAMMKPFLEVLLEEQLYFIDSVTLHTSVAHAVAMEMAVPTSKRDVFLDNENDPEHIHTQLKELVALAKTQGSAIGIGHFRSGTALVLEEALPGIEQQGIKLVHISELVQ